MNTSWYRLPHRADSDNRAASPSGLCSFRHPHESASQNGSSSASAGGVRVLAATDRKADESWKRNGSVVAELDKVSKTRVSGHSGAHNKSSLRSPVSADSRFLFSKRLVERG